MHSYISNEKTLLSLGLAWLGFAALMFLFHQYGTDFAVADHLFSLEGGEWALKHHVITETLLHEGGRAVSETLAAIAIMGFVASMACPRLRAWRRAAGYLVLTVLISTLSISVIKQLVSMDCPWDLARYGGDMPFIGLFEVRPDSLPDTACFPAGHASAGYAWIALYFFFKATRPRWRWLGLAVGLSMGLAFGFAQQLRGAHFLSHDLWTLMICWTTSTLLARGLLQAQRQVRAKSHSSALAANPIARHSV